MTRGGFFAVYASTLLVGDGFPDLTLAGIGGWLRLRAAFDLTEEPVTEARVEQLGLSTELLDELKAAHVLEETDGRYTPVGMPDMPRRPSDEPEATRLRKAREREREKEAKRESTSLHVTPLHSSVTTSRVTLRDTTSRVTPRDTRASGLVRTCTDGDGQKPVKNDGATAIGQEVSSKTTPPPTSLKGTLGSFQDIMAARPTTKYPRTTTTATCFFCHQAAEPGTWHRTGTGRISHNGGCPAAVAGRKP
ncbi:MAG: hypothetical protein ABSH20_32095 [Tepidisphaeraceae bacterium]